MIIYKITNVKNNKIYVGQTIKTLDHRLKRHILKAKNRVNRYLYDAMNFYGYENFVIEKIDECVSKSDMNEKEKMWITHYRSNQKEFGYNMTEGGDGGLMPVELYEKIAKMKRGVPLSAETRQKISKSNKGKTVSPETRIKLSLSNTGRKQSELQKMRTSIRQKGNAFFEDKHHTEKSKHKMAVAKTGKSIFSAEEKEKRKNRWTNDKNPNFINISKEQLLNHIKSGMQNKEIAILFGCSLPTVIAKIKYFFDVTPTTLRANLGIINKRPSEYKKIDFSMLTTMIKDNKLRKDIAKTFSISEVQLNKKIKNEYGYGFSTLKEKINERK